MKLYGEMKDFGHALPGLLYGVTPKSIMSRAAMSDIDFGLGVFANGDGGCVVGNVNNVTTVTLGAMSQNDVVTLTINGHEVSLTLTDSTAAANAAAVADAVNATRQIEAEGIVASIGASNTLVLTNRNAKVVTVTGTVGSTAVTTAASSTKFFAGLAVCHQRSYVDGTKGYPAGETVNVLEKGFAYGVVADGITPADGVAAYVDPTTGKFTTDTTKTATGAYFRSALVPSANNDKIALLELNGIKA